MTQEPERVAEVTKKLDEAIGKIRTLPSKRQDDAAELLLTLVEQESTPRYELTADQTLEVKAALARADTGEFAGDADVEAVLAKHRG